MPRAARSTRSLGVLLLALGGCGEPVPAPAATPPRSAAAPAPPPPNVLLITHDTTRADHLGCYGYELPTSPALDALAERGTLFEQCLSTASVTPVSHASLFTGLNPYQHGLRVMYGGADRLPEGVTTLAEVLGDAGWSTAAFTSAFPVSERFGLDRGFDVFDNGLDTPPDEVMTQDPEGQARWDTSRFQRRSDETTDAALEWLRGATEPFLLWVHYWDPHDPRLVPPRDVIQRFGALEGATLYDAEIAYVDSQFERLLDGLHARLERTLVVVTADHGEGLGEHDWQHHRLLYQEQIHLPLVLAGPGVPSGRSVPDLVRSIDVLPTVLELVDVPLPVTVEGRSLVPLLRGEPDPPRVAYADQLNAFDTNALMLEKRPDADLLFCVVDGRWKLVHRPTAPEQSELFDLEADPDEAVNLLQREPEVVRRLLEDLAARPGAIVTEGFGAGDGDDATLRALEELGYLDGAEDGGGER